jgi:hypothetical protein
MKLLNTAENRNYRRKTQKIWKKTRRNTEENKMKGFNFSLKVCDNGIGRGM